MRLARSVPSSQQQHVRISRLNEATREHPRGNGSGENKPVICDEFSLKSHAMPVDLETERKRTSEVTPSPASSGTKAETLSATRKIYTPTTPIPRTPRGIAPKARRIPVPTTFERRMSGEHCCGSVEEVTGTVFGKPGTPAGTPTRGYQRDGTPATATPASNQKVEATAQMTPAKLHSGALRVLHAPSEISVKAQSVMSWPSEEDRAAEHRRMVPQKASEIATAGTSTTPVAQEFMLPQGDSSEDLTQSAYCVGDFFDMASQKSNPAFPLSCDEDSRVVSPALAGC